MAVSVRIFRDEQIVADEQCRLHRSRRDVEWLEQEGADDERDDQRVEDHAYRFGNAAFLPLLVRRYAHLPFVPRRLCPPRAFVRWGVMSWGCPHFGAASLAGRRRRG